MEALDKWIAARKGFENAALGFLGACATLKEVAIQSGASLAREEMIEIFMNQYESVVDSFDLIQGRMHHSQRVLNAVANLSAQRAPISKLPAEILSRIFSAFLTFSLHGSHELLNIISVCARWYQVATTTPTLWNHVDLRTYPEQIYEEASSGFGWINFFLTRSQGLPVHFNLSSDGRYSNDWDMFELVLLIKNYPTAVGSIRLHGGEFYKYIDSANYSFTESMRLLLTTPGTSVSLRSLAKAVLRPALFERLSIWPSTSLPQLVELNLENLAEPACPSPSAICMMISACPLLHTLRLWNLETEPCGPLPSSIQLPNLRLLDLYNAPNIIPPLSSRIFPGTHRLDVRLDIHSSNTYQTSEAFRALFSRSNVSSLTVREIYEINYMTPCLMSIIPDLRVLVLDISRCYPKDILDNMLEYLTGLDSSQPPLRLRALGLMSGEVNSSLTAKLKMVVEAIRPHTLVFIDINFSEIDDQDKGSHADQQPDQRELSSGDLPSELERWFRGSVDRIATYPQYPGRLYQGVDSFMEQLANFE
ncbi:pyrolysin [Ceratobasidium sp. AG-Ba]|nr:pyrolysin [Ceratobasidium sp. AG-Ba]